MIIMNKRDYIFYIQEHRKGVQKHPKRLKCGAGLFMRWDCIRFSIEEDLGLHNKGKQESFIEGEIKNVSNNLQDTDFVKGGHVIHVKRVPWWKLWEDVKENKKPLFGPIYYPPVIQSYLNSASSSLT